MPETEREREEVEFHPVSGSPDVLKERRREMEEFPFDPSVEYSFSPHAAEHVENHKRFSPRDEEDIEWYTAMRREWMIDGEKTRALLRYHPGEEKWQFLLARTTDARPLRVAIDGAESKALVSDRDPVTALRGGLTLLDRIDGSANLMTDPISGWSKQQKKADVQGRGATIRAAA